MQAALVFGRHLFAKCRGYTDAKLCWAPRGVRPPLSMLPQLSSLYEEAERAFEYAEQYTARCESTSRALVLLVRGDPAEAGDSSEGGRSEHR